LADWNDWSHADKIAHRIIDMVNEERAKPEFSPTKFFAGLFRGLVDYQRSAEGTNPPAPFIAVHDAACACLKSMMIRYR
jgi:hypothetical protein